MKYSKPKQKRIRRFITQPIKTIPQATSPIKSHVSQLIIDLCENCNQQIQLSNLQESNKLVQKIDKLMAALPQEDSNYFRLSSLTYNTKASYHRKNNEPLEALLLIDKAIEIQKRGNVDTIDRARTLLNKSVIIGQIARKEGKQGKQIECTHEGAISLAKEALQIIKNRPQGKQFIPKEQYKLGEIIIISFHNIATELVCLKNEQEGYNLYKKAHDLALRVLGPRHSLTIHLKSIIGKYKEQKKDWKKVMISSKTSQKSFSNTKRMSKSGNKKKLEDSKKYESFFQIYGYQNKKKSKETNRSDVDMDSLQNIQKVYKSSNPSNTKRSYFPQLNRRNIRDVIKDKRQIADNRFVYSVNDNKKEKQRTNQENVTNKLKTVQSLKTQQIKLFSYNKTEQAKQEEKHKKALMDNQKVIPQSHYQQDKKQIKKEFESPSKVQEETKKIEQGGCQLI